MIVRPGNSRILVHGVIDDPAVVRHVEPYGVDPVPVHGEKRIDPVAGGFGHLFVVHRPVGVGQKLPGQGEFQGHQESGPVDGVEPNDVLADDLAVGRPHRTRLVRATTTKRVAGHCQVVQQRIQPHVYRLAVVAGHRNPPRQARRGSRYGEVAEPTLNLLHHQRHALFGDDGGRVLRVVFEQGIPKGGQPEMVVGLRGPFHLLPRLHRDDLGVAGRRVEDPLDLRFGVEGLVAHAVPPLVARLVDVASVVELAPDVLHHPLVVGVGGPDEPVVADVGGVAERLELLRVTVAEELHVSVRPLRRLLYLHAMLVGARQERGPFVAAEFRPSFQYVREDKRVQVTDVRSLSTHTHTHMLSQRRPRLRVLAGENLT